jgi:phosphoglycolate phosphatase
MLHELTRELGQDIGRTVMIGDTTHDLQMAQNAGAQGLGVCYGAHPADSLRAMSPVHCATSIADLQAWLLEHA